MIIDGIMTPIVYPIRYHEACTQPIKLCSTVQQWMKYALLANEIGALRCKHR
jgi:hypothetical protein